MTNAVLFDGTGYATAPNIGNILALTTFRVERDNVTWANSAGYLFSQRGLDGSALEFGLFRAGNGDLTMWIGGESTVIVSSPPNLDDESVILDINITTGAYTINWGATTYTGTAIVGAIRLDGVNWRWGARGASGTPDTTGGYLLLNGEMAGNERIYADGTLIREYVIPADELATSIVDTVSAQNITLRSFTTGGVVIYGIAPDAPTGFTAYTYDGNAPQGEYMYPSGETVAESQRSLWGAFKATATLVTGDVIYIPNNAEIAWSNDLTFEISAQNAPYELLGIYAWIASTDSVTAASDFRIDEGFIGLAPSLEAGQVFTINEEIPVGTYIGDLIFDGDSASISSSLIDVDLSGRLETAARIDFETLGATQTFTVTVTRGGQTATGTFDLQITDITNENAPSLQPAVFELVEGNAIGVEVATIQSQNITTMTTQSTEFAVTNAGVVTALKSFDFNVQQSTSFIVQASGPFGYLAVSYTVNISREPVQPFSFTNQSGVGLNQPVESNSVTLEMDVGTQEVAYVAGGEMSVAPDGVNFGAYSSASQSVGNGYAVKLRHISSPDSDTDTSTTLTVSTVSGTFTSTTVILSGANIPVISDQAFSIDQGNAPNQIIAQLAVTSATSVTVSGSQFSIVESLNKFYLAAVDSYDTPGPIVATLTAINSEGVDTATVTVTVNFVAPQEPPIITNEVIPLSGRSGETFPISFTSSKAGFFNYALALTGDPEPSNKTPIAIVQGNNSISITAPVAGVYNLYYTVEG